MIMIIKIITQPLQPDIHFQVSIQEGINSEKIPLNIMERHKEMKNISWKIPTLSWDISGQSLHVVAQSSFVVFSESCL